MSSRISPRPYLPNADRGIVDHVHFVDTCKSPSCQHLVHSLTKLPQFLVQVNVLIYSFDLTTDSPVSLLDTTFGNILLHSVEDRPKIIACVIMTARMQQTSNL